MLLLAQGSSSTIVRIRERVSLSLFSLARTRMESSSHIAQEGCYFHAYFPMSWLNVLLAVHNGDTFLDQLVAPSSQCRLAHRHFLFWWGKLRVQSCFSGASCAIGNLLDRQKSLFPLNPFSSTLVSRFSRVQISHSNCNQQRSIGGDNWGNLSLRQGEMWKLLGWVGGKGKGDGGGGSLNRWGWCGSAWSRSVLPFQPTSSGLYWILPRHQNESYWLW